MTYEHRDMVSNFDHEDKPTYKEVSRAEYIREHLEAMAMTCTSNLHLPTFIRSLQNLQTTAMSWDAQDRRDERLARGEKK